VLAAPAPALAQSRIGPFEQPAWIEREGTRIELAEGMAVRTGDVLQTGRGGRLGVDYADRVYIRLGPSTRLRLLGLEPERIRVEGKLLGVPAEGAAERQIRTQRALLVAGAARFVNERDESEFGFVVHLPDQQAGLRRGTLLAFAGPSAEACLLSGSALIQRANRMLTLSEAQSCYGARGQRPAERLSELEDTQPPAAPAAPPPPVARQAAPAAAPVAAAAAKGWYVNVVSPQERAEADAALAVMVKAGHAAEVLPVVVKGRQHYRVRIGGYASRDAAIAAATAIRQRYAQWKPWVTAD